MIRHSRNRRPVRWVRAGLKVAMLFSVAKASSAPISAAQPGPETMVTAWLRVASSVGKSAKVASGFQSKDGMNQEMVRLFLQSYNAGPYAVLKFRGTVPYRETRNYVPRVLSYYREDLDNTPYDALIRDSAERHGLDPQLVRAIMKAESGFKNRTTSWAGARGLMQVMPCTWDEVRQRFKMSWSYSSNVYDPAKNIEVACAYLSWVRYQFLPEHFDEFKNAPRRDSIAQPSASPLAIVIPSRPAPASATVPGGPLPSAAPRTLASNRAIEFSWN